MITKNRREEEKKKNVRRRGEKRNVKRERERERFFLRKWVAGWVCWPGGAPELLPCGLGCKR